MFKQFLPGLKNDARAPSSVQQPVGKVASRSIEPLPLETKPVNGASHMVAVLGAKGGVGATSIAVNIAAAVATQMTTTIVDANFQQPDVAHLLGQEPVHSVMEMLARTAELDRHLLEACLTSVSGAEQRFSLLSPPLDGQAAIKANLTELAQCLHSVRSMQSCWIVDMPRHLDKHFVTLSDQCDKIVLVFEATVSGIATTQRWLGVFKELGYASERIVCVLNRSGSKFSGIEQQLETCFPGQEIFRIPNASAIMWDSATRGMPAVMASPHHAYSRAVMKLSEQLIRSIDR